MLRAVLRIVLAASGAAFAAFIVAFLEALTVSSAVADAGEKPVPDVAGLFKADLGLLSPVALVVGGGLGVLVVMLRLDNPLGFLGRLRDGDLAARLRAAAGLPLGIVAAFLWTVAAAHVAKAGMESGKPVEAGLSIGIGAVAAFVVVGLVALALLPVVRRGLAVGSTSVPQLLDPALTGSVALVFVGIAFAVGIGLGDTSGAGGGFLGIFGVLKRPELDLRPVANAGVLAVGALLAPLALVEAEAKPDAKAMSAAGVGVVLHVILLTLCVLDASGLAETPVVARGLERHAPLGKPALALLRKLTDHDKDGYSARYAGGDCNDEDKRVNPNALDIPGNGIDEDCSGADTPAPPPPPVLAAGDPKNPAKKTDHRPQRTFNVILITVDTLRPDLGFMGYDKPTSPNLDKVAEKATVFDHAYSMASYTGKAVGPMLIGRYPSETLTNFDHFNTYYDGNVLVAERLHDAGIRTFAGMCHWYFRPSSGLKQGFDVWDTSAIPPGMGDNDTSLTSDRLSDLALRLLKRPENTGGEEAGSAINGGDLDDDAGAPAGGGAGGAGGVGGVGGAGGKKHRFFAWFHYFDPHAQYVPHEGVPDLTSKGPYGGARTLYDGEIWWTDKHLGRVLDYIASQPWADETAIVMTADHGEAFYEHGMSWHGMEVWEELVHVPLFVYVPGATPKHVTQKRSHIDIAPTILELMGVPLPDDDSLRGTSLLNDVYLPKDGEHEERDVYIDMPAGPYNTLRRAILTGPTPGMKLIHSGGFNYQLFDLAADPDERKNLSNDNEKLQPMIKAMNAYRGRLKEIEVRPK